MEKEVLIENLKSFDLDYEEIQIILELTTHKSITAVKLARLTHIPKTTLYRYLDTLIAKGFVTIALSSRGREYTLVKNVFELKLTEAKNKYDKLLEIKPVLEKQLFSELNTLGSTNTRIYYGLDGIKQIQWNVLSATTKIYYYTNARRKDLFGEKWFTKYCQEFVLRDKYEIGFESDKNSPVDVKEYFKEIPGYWERSEYVILKDVSFNGEVYIYDNVYAYYTWADNKFFGIEVENFPLVETQKKIFETFWNLVISSRSYISKHPKSRSIQISK